MVWRSPKQTDVEMAIIGATLYYVFRLPWLPLRQPEKPNSQQATLPHFRLPLFTSLTALKPPFQFARLQDFYGKFFHGFMRGVGKRDGVAAVDGLRVGDFLFAGVEVGVGGIGAAFLADVVQAAGFYGEPE